MDPTAELLRQILKCPPETCRGSVQAPPGDQQMWLKTQDSLVNLEHVQRISIFEDTRIVACYPEESGNQYGTVIAQLDSLEQAREFLSSLALRMGITQEAGDFILGMDAVFGGGKR